MRSGPAARFAGMALGLAFFCAATFVTYRELTALPLMRAASSIERSGRLPAASDRIRARLGWQVAAPVPCWGKRGPARVTAALFLLRLADADGGEADTLRATEIARAVVGQALACTPLDGHLWAVAADLSRRAGAEPRLLRTQLASSIRSSPFEGSALASRAAIIISSHERLDPSQDLILRSDLQVAARYLLPLQAAGILTDLGSNGERPLADQIYAGLSADRRTQIENAVEIENRKQQRLREIETHPSLRTNDR